MVEYNIDLSGRTILVTGAAGFIGSSLILRLLKSYGDAHIIGVDNLDDYYDVSMKLSRLTELEHSPAFTFIKADISDKNAVAEVFGSFHPDVVVNLAAQAGARASIDSPDKYISSNIVGFYNILEACRHSYDGGAKGVDHLVFASSSSVYGSNTEIPYSAADKTDSPVSLYAATKKCDELLAHAYSKLYDIPSTGLRFFTVYGPNGRPDMAYFSFTETLRKGGNIRLFNYGNCMRDFTYIDDIVEGIVRVMRHAPEKCTGSDDLPVPPYKIYNIGSGSPVNLLDFVSTLYEELVLSGVLPEGFDLKKSLELVPMQHGDVSVTFADTAPLREDFGFTPSTGLRDGLRAFAVWYASSCLK